MINRLWCRLLFVKPLLHSTQSTHYPPHPWRPPSAVFIITLPSIAAIIFVVVIWYNGNSSTQTYNNNKTKHREITQKVYLLEKHIRITYKQKNDSKRDKKNNPKNRLFMHSKLFTFLIYIYTNSNEMK